MTVCQLEEKAKGKMYPRTCPTCGLSGPCHKGLATGAHGEVVATADRAAIIRECVTWLAMHHADYKPEALAGQMACDLLAAK